MALKKADKVVLYPSRKVAGQWGWRYVAANGRRVAVAGELYYNKAHAERMVNKLFPGVAVEVGPNKGPKRAAKNAFPVGSFVEWNMSDGRLKRGTVSRVDNGYRTMQSDNGCAYMIPLKGIRHAKKQRPATPAEVRKFNAQKGKA
jgi:uncharacterized protein YegP (UPF0339 family)